MRFICHHCDQQIHASHVWEGLSVNCPACGSTTELKYRVGQEIPEMGYSLSFRDFKQLVTDKAYTMTIHPLVKGFLNCSVERAKGSVRLTAQDGSLIPLEAAHFEIQGNNESQRKIYDAAMDLWR
jgi:hypothetical protein